MYSMTSCELSDWKAGISWVMDFAWAFLRNAEGKCHLEASGKEKKRVVKEKRWFDKLLIIH